MTRVLKWFGIVALVVLLTFIIANWNSWDDGVLYLQDMFAYTETPAQPLNGNGRFGFCKQFVTLRNAQRAQFIKNYLDVRGIKIQRLPIYDTSSTICLCRFPDSRIEFVSANGVKHLGKF